MFNPDMHKNITYS